MSSSHPFTTTELRNCGVLLHPTALPGTPASGSLGRQAREWVELLGRSNVAVWQLLPLAPTDGTCSPYSSPSGSAINPWLIDADDLVEAGLLSPEDRTSLPTVIQSCRLDSAQASFRARAIATALRSGWSRQDRRYRRQFQQWKRQQRHCVRGI